MGGASFIDSCPPLRDNEEELIEFITGANICDFDEYEKAREDYFYCDLDARKELNEVIALLDMVHSKPTMQSLVVKAHCHYRDRILQKCNPKYVRCFSEEKKQEIKDRDEADFAQMEAIVARYYVEDFTWATHCDHDPNDD